MLSVIIPTMWKHEPFLNFFQTLLEINCIGEFIIINNDVQATPDHPALKHEKVRFHNSETNLFVAPSWNLGARLANHDKLAFLADDLICDTNLFERVNSFLDFPDVGMIGILTPYLETDCYRKMFTDGSIDIINPHATDLTGNKICSEVGMGNLFFLRKELWKDIPNVKIYYGEVLQWNRMEEIGKKNYMIVNCYAETPWHVTWRKMSEESKYATDIANYVVEDQKFCGSIGFRFK